MDHLPTIAAAARAMHLHRDLLPALLTEDGSVRRDNPTTEATPLLMHVHSDVLLADGTKVQRISTVISVRHRTGFHVAAERIFAIRPDVTLHVVELTERKTGTRSIALVAIQTTKDGDVIQTLFTDTDTPLASVADTATDTWTDAD